MESAVIRAFLLLRDRGSLCERIPVPTSSDAVRWRVPNDQRFVFADFDDGILMFDARVGSTHLLNATAVEALLILEESPDLSADEVYRALVERLELNPGALPFEAVAELLWQLENLGFVTPAA
jgi:PqqD family protein of HPr-rel-A system